ncbi:hypothetical protein [Cytobacillus praedii]|uniref:phage lytic cycle repressor MrpR family protein n=1 Tax=Cytobacillus praedii TaxID=1742358 RepID=UPI002E1F7B04|nr:hypothetical protein [Cytobacillus praedii]
MEYYNYPIKNRYLESIDNENSRTTIGYIFNHSLRTEMILEKDMYNFSREDIESVMRNISPGTANYAKSSLFHIRSYISWAIKHGYRDNNMNPLDNITGAWASKFVDRTSKIHYSEEELEDLLSEFHNAQDQAMVRLWFEGAGGREFSEVKNLSYYDIDWINNILTLRDESRNERKITVSDKCMKYIENAYRQTNYIFVKDGEIVSERPLEQSDFILRNVAHRKVDEKTNEIGSGSIYKRLKELKVYFGLDVFSPNAIRQSGQIYMVSAIYERDGHFGDKLQWYEIGDRFNVTKVNNNPNVTMMKNYISTEILKDLYDLDIKIEKRRS